MVTNWEQDLLPDVYSHIHDNRSKVSKNQITFVVRQVKVLRTWRETYLSSRQMATASSLFKPFFNFHSCHLSNARPMVTRFWCCDVDVVLCCRLGCVEAFARCLAGSWDIFHSQQSGQNIWLFRHCAGDAVNLLMSETWKGKGSLWKIGFEFIVWFSVFVTPTEAHWREGSLVSSFFWMPFFIIPFFLQHL